MSQELSNLKRRSPHAKFLNMIYVGRNSDSDPGNLDAKYFKKLFSVGFLMTDGFAFGSARALVMRTRVAEFVKVCTKSIHLERVLVNLAFNLCWSPNLTGLAL